MGVHGVLDQMIEGQAQRGDLLLCRQGFELPTSTLELLEKQEGKGSVVLQLGMLLAPAPLFCSGGQRALVAAIGHVLKTGEAVSHQAQVMALLVR